MTPKEQRQFNRTAHENVAKMDPQDRESLEFVVGWAADRSARIKRENR